MEKTPDPRTLDMYSSVNKYHPRHDPRHGNVDKGSYSAKPTHPRHDPRQCNEDEGFSIRRSAYPRHDAILEGEDNERRDELDVLRKNVLPLYRLVNL